MDLWKYVLVKYVGRFSAYSIYSFSAEACKRKYSFIAMLLCFFNGSLWSSNDLWTFERLVKREKENACHCVVFSIITVRQTSQKEFRQEKREASTCNIILINRKVVQSLKIIQSINQSIINCSKPSKSQKYYQSSWKRIKLEKETATPNNIFCLEKRTDHSQSSRGEVKTEYREDGMRGYQTSSAYGIPAGLSHWVAPVCSL